MKSRNLVHAFVSRNIITTEENVRTIQSSNPVSLLKPATRVKGLMFTHGIHITFQDIFRRSIERVEKLSNGSVRIRPKRGAICVRFEHGASVSQTESVSVRVEPRPCSYP